MTELEELRIAYAECSRQRNELLAIRKQPAQPLTDEQIKDVATSCMWWVREQDILDDAIEFARAIEAAHGITKGERK
jgi:hypothetical protein